MSGAALAAALLFPTLAAAAPAARANPALLSIRATADGVRATTGADEDGNAWQVVLDGRANAWSAPAPVPPVTDTRLDQVLVFNGGLFDQFPAGDKIDLGDGFVLARSDTGYALIDHGTDRGWPVVTENEVGTWGREVRLGLPRTYPEDRLYQLLATGALKNVPGPYVRVGDALWFGLAGGFSGSEGQFGGLVVYDIAQHAFRVVRHKFLVDATVTRLLAVGDELWIGTGRFGATHLEGLRGMLVHRPKRREWRQFSTENARISGDLVYDATALGRMLWVTTDGGISRYDLDRSLWTSWYWHALPPAVDETPGPGFVLKRDRPNTVAEDFIK